MLTRTRHTVVALLLLAACVRRPTSAPVTAQPAADSLTFEQFVSDYAEGGRRGAPPQTDSLGWLHAAAAPAEREAAARASAQLAQLRTIDTTHLSVPQRIDWLLVESWLKRTVYDTVLHNAERVPGRYLTLGNLTWRVAGGTPPTPADWMSIRTDLVRAPRVLALGRGQLAAPPPLWVHLAVSTARSYAGFLAGEYIERVGSDAPDSLRPSLLAAGASARAALEAYAAFLSDTLRAGPENSWAAGGAYYDWVLQEVNFLPFTAQTMIEEGRRIHAATKRALDSLAARVRPGTPWHALADEMQGRHPEAGRITEAYHQASDRVLALLRRDSLVAIPPGERLTFVPTPLQLRETYAWGGYGGITMRDSTATGRFFVTDVAPGMSADEVQQKLRTQNDGWIHVIALHEGYPGHHLQTVYARRNPRRLRRMGSNTYYGEGWALFAEHWMARAGLFRDDPDGQLGQLQMRLWRTARVIIDPSLHTGAMTYEQAVRFFVDEVGLTRTAAEAEVNRFTTWPTQAPSYIIGWLEIERLERDVRQALEPRFSERDFVEKVLEAGPLPLALLRRAVLYAYNLGS
jgi:uncharacterized protein (DUF885 family)